MTKVKGIRKGFTLIELLVVIGILAILLTIVLIAINPARQFGLANDTKRRSEVLSILNAVHQYQADPANKGVLPTMIPTADADPATPLINDAVEISDATAAGVDLCGILVPGYISALPVDPENPGSTKEPVTTCTAAADEYNTGYSIVKDSAGRVTVFAPETSDYTTPMISITR